MYRHGDDEPGCCDILCSASGDDAIVYRLFVDDRLLGRLLFRKSNTTGQLQRRFKRHDRRKLELRGTDPARYAVLQRLPSSRLRHNDSAKFICLRRLKSRSGLGVLYRQLAVHLYLPKQRLRKNDQDQPSPVAVGLYSVQYLNFGRRALTKALRALRLNERDESLAVALPEFERA
jgi:hypothetical protein